MEPFSSLSFFISIFLLLSPILFNPSNCQQNYLNNTQLSCQNTPSISKGYLCNGPEASCQAYITFRSQPPFDSPTKIAYLLGSEATSIAAINNISSSDNAIPPGNLVIVPISCTCGSGSLYQHNTPYTIKANETYFTIANDTYQGLTTCQALMGQNYYDEVSLLPGMQLTVPLRCACPSANQTADGVSSLLAYMVTWKDTFGSIAKLFGVDEKSIPEANNLSQDSTIFPFTPLLIPLKRESCPGNPEKFFCYCPIDGSPEELNYCQTKGKKFPVKLVALSGSGIGLGLLCIFLCGYHLYKFLRKRKNRLQREKLFRQNGGFLLQQRLSSSGITEKAKIFTAKELEKATDNYNKSRFLGQGGFGIVYKGMLPDGTIVAVKRSKAIDESQTEQFINEVVILSQINHRNIVQLLGCCLETEAPVLVYEFISNGTLSHHIRNHEQEQDSSISWARRVQIACEVAGALAYMHSAASVPIFHRDIKSSNILLDEKYKAKVSDFGISRCIPDDKTHVTTAVQGTFGYLDPEYFQSSQFTDKSDVYSFGVVLVELLTGKNPTSLALYEEERNLVACFISLAKESKVMEILDGRVAKEASVEEIEAVVELAMSCLRLNGKKRPTMKHVALELEGLRRSQRSLEVKEAVQQVLKEEMPMSGQESFTQSLEFPLQMESTSFNEFILSERRQTMEPFSSLGFFISAFLLLSPILFNPSNCQQNYINNLQLDCENATSISKGYLCNGPEASCQAYITFRSQPPFDSPTKIAYLLGSEATSIAAINNISSSDNAIPPGNLVIIPISCSCGSGSLYQHSTPYTVKANETYFSISNNTYQGLTTCQALMGQNYYDGLSLLPGMQLTVPLRCACPSANQSADKVSSLLAYMVTWGDSFGSIAKLFGVDEKSIPEANNMSQDSIIYPFTPLLIPLKRESCSGNPEKFFCYCPTDGSLEACQIEGKKFPVKLVTLSGIGVGLGLLCIFLCGYNLYKFLRKRKNKLQREKLFRQNGGFLLQQRLSYNGSTEKAKIFTVEELEKATDNYNRSRFLGQGGFGIVYKGMLADGTIVAVKRSKAIDESQIEQFINEVVILSQINHRNIVKLLGCCLETEAPVLVYEFISNGTLSHHIRNHEQEQDSSLSWACRVQIACEVAGALAYMHSAASVPIFHRDIKSSNILLDEKYNAKVSDFGISRCITDDKTHVTTAVQGTFGYLDPEYFQSSQFTEKSDVYSFGVVLVELLTGKNPTSLVLYEEERNLIACFISLAKESKVMEILDGRVAKEASEEEIEAVVELAMSCLRLNGKKRPTMKHVALELEGLRRSQRCLEVKEDVHQVLTEEISMSGQESITKSLEFPLQMESTSF
ncbi:uncharacterized protein LOC123203463 [Mangifera indica]|uniref:uncharacterized protein LOC123203463 n=1 Tax=Mangifera indica TaxID=29780 RepID=UPI001CFA8723|nr:uncharacterized protein LOC123203463 [Mangifera indica]